MSQTFLSGFRATPQGLIALCITAIALTLILNLSGCSSTSQRKVGAGDTAWRTRNAPRSAAAQEKGNEVALFSLGLMNIGYRFGGKNPEAGLDFHNPPISNYKARLPTLRNEDDRLAQNKFTQATWCFSTH